MAATAPTNLHHLAPRWRTRHLFLIRQKKLFFPNRVFFDEERWEDFFSKAKKKDGEVLKARWQMVEEGKTSLDRVFFLK